MISLVVGVIVLIAVYLLQQYGAPYLAGLAAVIPIKIFTAGLVAQEVGGMSQLYKTIEAMILGQFVWGFAMVFIWYIMRGSV